MNQERPNLIVHYSRGEPFQSITSVPTSIRKDVINCLHEGNAWGLNRFSHPEYLPQRFEVEKILRQEFIRKGGNPALEHPIYFFLGRQPGFEQNPKNKCYSIELEHLSQEWVSFTYGDSMLSLNFQNRKQSGPHYENPLCGELFTLAQLDDLLTSPLFPGQAPLAIEAQVWIKPPPQIVRLLET